jgi:hypothetical protein
MLNVCQALSEKNRTLKISRLLNKIETESEFHFYFIENKELSLTSHILFAYPET